MTLLPWHSLDQIIDIYQKTRPSDPTRHGIVTECIKFVYICLKKRLDTCIFMISRNVILQRDYTQLIELVRKSYYIIISCYGGKQFLPPTFL